MSKTISFNHRMLKAVVDGNKTQTRRLIKSSQPKYEQGEVIQIKGSEVLLRVLSIRKEKLYDISNDDVRAEGFRSKDEFVSYIGAIYPDLQGNPELWVISFEVVK